MRNVIQTWLYLVGTASRARKLRMRLDGLQSPPLDPMFGPEPLQCPLTVLYGAETSRAAYADPSLRPALDAWDTGAVSPADLRRWCIEIERGNYAGAIFGGFSGSWRVSQAALASPLAMTVRIPAL